MKKTRTTKQRWQKTFVILALIPGSLFAGFPVLWMFSNSIKSNSDIFAYPPKFIPKNSSFASYSAIFTDPEKIRFFINSYSIALAVTIFTLLVSIPAAYTFSRYNFKFKQVINGVIISLQAIPPITLMIPYFAIIVKLHIYNTYQGLILTYMVFTMPYAIIMLTGYFNTLPKELDEAVKIDGGSAMTTLWKVLVPIAIPGIVTVGIYNFMICWNEFLFALTLTKTNEMRTVPVGIQLLMGQHAYKWNEMMAMSALGCLPVLLIFLFFQRYFVGGLASGSVKS